MRKLLAVLLVLALVYEPVFAGIPSNKSMFVGGTVKALPAKALGPLSTDDEKTLVFTWQQDKAKGEWKIPYDKVTALAYGQHAGRRVGATIALGVTTLGIGALPLLFSKKRRHYLTIEFTDEAGLAQAAIFEVGKVAIRTTLKSLEVRTGKKVEFEDEEARKAGTK